VVTTVNPGEGARLALLDLGNCYPAGTVITYAADLFGSAFWGGHFKNWDMYIVAGYSLADLAAKEAAVDAGGTGYIGYGLHLATSDSTAGTENLLHQTSSATSPLASTARYLSWWVKPQFNAVPWYANGTPSTFTLVGVGGASTTSCPVDPPVADFSADNVTVEIGTTINFTDLSTNTPTSWAWTFGDAGTSTSQNPTHAYTNPGSYEVTLTATNAGGSDSEGPPGDIRRLSRLRTVGRGEVGRGRVERGRMAGRDPVRHPRQYPLGSGPG
jgi:plastocyanin